MTDILIIIKGKYINHQYKKLIERPLQTPLHFNLSPICIAILGVALVFSDPVQAEEANVSELKAENARLKEALEKIQRQLDAQSANGVTAANPESVSTAENPASAIETAKLDSDAEQDEGKHSFLNEVLVRAKKRSEVAKLKEVPKSVSAVSGQELDKYSATSMTDILKRVGNVQWNFGNPRTGSFTLRGLSAGSNDQIDPSVGVVFDGISYAYSPLSAGTDFFDVESVNVTRGPQGSAGHKNTSLGEIQITTKKPTFNSEADASVLWGQNNTVKTQAVIGGSVVDNVLAWRTSFLRNQADGFYSNAYPDNPQRQSYVNTDRTFARTQFLYTPTDNLKALFSLHYQPKGSEFLNGLSYKVQEPLAYTNGGTVNRINLTQTKLQRQWFTNAFPKYSVNDYYSFPIYSDNNGGIMTATRGANVNLDYKLPGHTLKYIAGYKDHYFTAANDEGTPFNVTTDGGYITNYDQITQELTFENDKGSFVDYKGGIYSFFSSNNSNSRTRYGSDAGAWYANGPTVNANTGALSSQFDCLYSGIYCAGAGYTGSISGTTVNVTTPGTVNTAGQAGEGRPLLSAALNNLYKNTVTYTRNKSQALFGEAQWHLSEPLTLTTGLRATREDRSGNGSIVIADQGAGALLNPVNVGPVAMNGFNVNGTSGALSLSGTPDQQAAQQAVANAAAQQFFGTSTYAGLSANQKVLIAQAKAVRNSQLSTLYNTTKASPFNGILPSGNVSLSYKINDNYSPYFTWQRGAKAGVAQVAAMYNLTQTGGLDKPVRPEFSDTYEIGLKSTLFDKKLDVNLDFFIDNIKDFQQTVAVVDAYKSLNTAANCPGYTQCYTTAIGNVSGVQVKGVELDANYKVLDNLSFRFAGAYNDAVYTDYANSGLPADTPSTTANGGYQSLTGKTVPRAPKFTGNLSADYSQPIFDKFVLHTNVNLNYVGKQNYDLNASGYGWLDPYTLTDFSIGIGRKDQLFDANLIVKNIFDTGYRTQQSWNSYTPGFGRWMGVQFTTKF